MRFDWDINKTILWLLPTPLRLRRQWAWLKVLIYPISTAYQVFLNYRDQQLYESYLTGQTIQLQRLLNDRFDNSLRRIVIIHSSDSDIPLYLDQENQPAQDLNLYLDEESQPDTVILYLDGEPGASLLVDFRVIAPISLTNAQIEIENLVRQYALVDKTFDVVFA